MHILNKKNIIRLLTAMSMLIMLALPISAQEQTDSVITFRFLTGKNMFYAPGLNNGPELKRLFGVVDQYKDKILDHKILLHVDGYSTAKRTDKENLAIAKIRSNRVKSELITRKGLKEDCFVTHNHAENGDFVTVQMVIRRDDIVAEEPTPAPEPEPEPENQSVAPADTIVEIVEEQPIPQTAEPLKVERADSRFALKTNMLDYAILMPNIEAEWAFADRWSLALEAQGAWYAKSNPHKVYRIATVMPEVRFWVISHSRWHGMYVGLFGGAGMYDLHFRPTRKGHEGEGYMAGLSVGYMWPIAKHLSLDAGVGVGYMRLHDKVYSPLAGHFLYQYTKNIDYIGPLRLKLSLVWRIPM